MELVWNQVVDYYTQRQVEAQFTNLELGSFHHAGNYRKLSGKGAEVKHLVSSLLHGWQKQCSAFVRQHMFVQAMLHNNCEVRDMLAHRKRQNGVANC